MPKHIREIDSLGNEIPDGESGRDHLIPYVHMQTERTTTSGSKLRKTNGNQHTFTQPAIKPTIKRRRFTKTS